MLQKTFFLNIVIALLITTFIVSIGQITVYADDKDAGVTCKPGIDFCKDDKTTGTSYDCMPEKGFNFQTCKQPDCEFRCRPSTVKDTFGRVEPPVPLLGFLQKDPTGASAISQFLSNFVTLLFSIAAIALIFMILWGALDWLTSGGDKEKLANAQKRIINAFIGIILFATAFAIIRVVGTFTGFTFFAGQNGPADPRCTYNNCGNYGDCANYLNTTCKKFSTAPGDCTCGP